VLRQLISLKHWVRHLVWSHLQWFICVGGNLGSQETDTNYYILFSCIILNKRRNTLQFQGPQNLQSRMLDHHKLFQCCKTGNVISIVIRDTFWIIQWSIPEYKNAFFLITVIIWLATSMIFFLIELYENCILSKNILDIPVWQ
jgi:hypothetical protein